MTYVLGKQSVARLAGVHPDLVKVVRRAIDLTGQDFGVYEGVRTQKTQNAYFRKGVTRVRHSKHQVQPDGFGHAVDLVPYVAGRLRWEWPPIYEIAAAMCEAAVELGVDVRWGGVWDRGLNGLIPMAEAMKSAVADYCERHPGPDFIDGPHFELRQ